MSSTSQRTRVGQLPVPPMLDFWQKMAGNSLPSQQHKTGKLAFPSPDGIIFEMEEEKKEFGLTLSQCFRRVLGRWKGVCSPTVGDLYKILETLDLGGEAERCFDEYFEDQA